MGVDYASASGRNKGRLRAFLSDLKPFAQNNLEKAPNFSETALDQYG
jgi:hypothetical protein